MGLIFGHHKHSKPTYTGLATQTSTTTIPLPIAFGQARISPNIIWQGDFTAHAQKQKSGKGLGGSSTVSYTYTASFIMALAWGVVTDCVRVWKDQSKNASFSSLGFSLLTGTTPQAPWGFMTSNHAAQALGYPGVAQMVVSNYDLGNSNALPQHSFEMKLPLNNTAPGATGDADPAQCVDSFLNNSGYGALAGNAMTVESLMSTGAATTTGDAAFQTYCKAQGFGMSPVLESQETGLAVLDRWTTIFNTSLVWTGYSLQFLPYGSETIVGNGVTYLPDVSVQFAFTDKDFIASGGAEPIKFHRVSPADAFNSYTFEIKNRGNEYNSEPVEWRDQGLVDQFGVKAQSSYKAAEICQPAMGATLTSMFGQRRAYQRNEYEFTVPPAYMLLLPGAIGTITDPMLGTINVRLIDIDEQGDGSLKMLAEEFNDSVTLSGAPGSQAIANTPVNTATLAGAVNPPILIQPNPLLTSGNPEVWAAVSGGDGTTADPNWGGAQVWISTDGGTSYNMVGQVTAPARMGKLSAGLAAYGGANPDAGNTLGVNSAMSAAQFSSTTAASAAAGVTLCYIKPEGANVAEFLSYTTAALTGANAYNLTGLYRGLYGSTPGAHGIGAAFARLDSQSVFKYTFPLSLIGSTIFVKFVSFNIWNQGYQDISVVTAYSLTLSGAYTYGIGISGLNNVSGTPATGNTLIYNSGTGLWVPGAAGGAYTSRAVTSGEGATAIVIGAPVYASAADTVKRAQANAKATSKLAGIGADVSIAAAAVGNIATSGTLTATTAQWDAVAGTTGGLAFNTTYFVDPANPGKITATPPATVGQCITVVGLAISTTELELGILPPVLL